jgi:alcohol dehydrogenase
MPTEIFFGVGQVDRLTELLIGRKQVVLVTDRGLKELPFVRAIVQRLSPAAVFSDVDANPTVANVDQLTQVLRAKKADAVVAVGGGSVMDCAKTACCLAKTDELSVRAFHTENKRFDTCRVPLIVVPTTAGTGSEVTPFAVLDDTEKRVKCPVASDSFYPSVAIIDPQLTVSLPKKITAATGMDALSHALEGYWSKNHQPICNLLAKEAARLIFKNLPKVYENPADLEARTAMSYAALLAGIAFQRPGNAMVHACSYPLSSLYHLQHGTACAFTLEYALKLNAPAMNGRMDEFAEYCGFATIDAMSRAIRDLKTAGGLPCTLKEAGIPDDGIGELIKDSFHPVVKNNPVVVTEDHLRQMYEGLVA